MAATTFVFSVEVNARVASPCTHMQKFISRIDPAVERVWRENRCLTEGSIAVYRMWVRRFVERCRANKLDRNSQLTLAGVSSLASWYSRVRKLDPQETFWGALNRRIFTYSKHRQPFDFPTVARDPSSPIGCAASAVLQSL
jgi:hypothetical protein